MMQSKSLTIALTVAGTIALVVGGALMLAPTAMYAANGVELAREPSLLSEIRAPGGALVALGALIVAGAFRPRLTLPAILASATVYLGYGASRVLSMLVDGMPATGLVVATGLEIVIGLGFALWLLRARARA